MNAPPPPPRLGRLGFVYEWCGCGIAPQRGDSTLGTRLPDVDFRPPDEVSARPILRPVATRPADNLEVGHFRLLTLSAAACGYRRFSGIEARRDDPGPIGRHLPPVSDSASSRLLLTANWRPGRVPGPPPFSGGRWQRLALGSQLEPLAQASRGQHGGSPAPSREPGAGRGRERGQDGIA